MNRFARDAKIAANVTSRRKPGADHADSLPYQPVRDYNNASYVFVPCQGSKLALRSRMPLRNLGRVRKATLAKELQTKK